MLTIEIGKNKDAKDLLRSKKSLWVSALKKSSQPTTLATVLAKSQMRPESGAQQMSKRSLCSLTQHTTEHALHQMPWWELGMWGYSGDHRAQWRLRRGPALGRVPGQASQAA